MIWSTFFSLPFSFSRCFWYGSCLVRTKICSLWLSIVCLCKFWMCVNKLYVNIRENVVVISWKKRILTIYHRKSINNGDSVSLFENVCAWMNSIVVKHGTECEKTSKVPEFKVCCCARWLFVCHVHDVEHLTVLSIRKLAFVFAFVRHQIKFHDLLLWVLLHSDFPRAISLICFGCLFSACSKTNKFRPTPGSYIDQQQWLAIVASHWHSLHSLHTEYSRRNVLEGRPKTARSHRNWFFLLLVRKHHKLFDGISNVKLHEYGNCIFQFT